MAVLYGRVIEVQVAGLRIRDLHISGTVERQGDQTQSKCSLTIYNLSTANEDRIYERGGVVTVAAGYQDRADQIFQGNIQRVTRLRSGLASEVRIEAGDEVRAVQRLGGVSMIDIAGPATVRSIAAQFITDMELRPGPLDAIPADATETDFYWTGPADAGLSAMLRKIDLEWFEDDSGW